MTKTTMYIFIFLFFIPATYAQKVLRSTLLQVSDKKTTHLIFPYVIIGGDCGSSDVRAQKMKGAVNILQVKAVKADFPPTNLTVITEEGKLYPFEVRYCAYPGALNVRFEKDSAASIVNTMTYNPRVMEEHAAQIIAANKNHHVRYISPAGLEVKLKGIYTDDQVLYYHVSMTNYSSLDYVIDALRCTVEDRSAGRRTVRQVLELFPLLVYGRHALLHRDSTIQFVIALARKTLRRSQRLFIRIMENNGARHLFLLVKPRQLLRARPM